MRKLVADDGSRKSLPGAGSGLSPLCVEAVTPAAATIPPVWVKLPAVGRPFGRSDREIRVAVALGVIATFRPLTEERAIGFVQGWTYCCRRTAQRYLELLRELRLLHGLAPDRRYFRRECWRQTIKLDVRPEKGTGILHHVALSYATFRSMQHRRRSNLTYLSRLFRCSRAAVAGWVRRGQNLAQAVLQPCTSPLRRRSRERFPGEGREPTRFGHLLYPIPPPRTEMARQRRGTDQDRRKGDAPGVRRDDGGQVVRNEGQQRYGTPDGRPAPGDRCAELMHGMPEFGPPPGWKEPDLNTDRLNPRLPRTTGARGEPQKPDVDFYTALARMRMRVAAEASAAVPVVATHRRPRTMTPERLAEIVRRRASRKNGNGAVESPPQ